MKPYLLVCVVLLVTPLQSAPNRQYDFVVAQDGSGNYTRIQDAVDACRDFAERRYYIRIRNGVYNGKLTIPSWKTHITLVGENTDSTIITGNDYSGKTDASGTTLNTFRTYTVKVAGNDNAIENVTIINSAGRVGQAVALHVEGDRCTFRHCRLIGNQDTHYAAGENSRQYYADCTIEGTTDFIFGAATAVFERCTIVSKANSYITAASTPPTREFGFVFLQCSLLADSTATHVYLGRPWRLHAYTAFLQCTMGPHIVPEGWHNWNKPEAEKTARYYEFNSSGPGASPATRVPWSRQLSQQEAEDLTAEAILRGTDNWKVNQ